MKLHWRKHQRALYLCIVDTGILFALGAGDSVTGRTDYWNYPEEAADVDSIGTWNQTWADLIKSPDLVVASGFIDDNIRQQLEENGTAIFITNASDLIRRKTSEHDSSDMMQRQKKL